MALIQGTRPQTNSLNAPYTASQNTDKFSLFPCRQLSKQRNILFTIYNVCVNISATKRVAYWRGKTIV
jgi:hypothetical protein